MKIVVTGGGLGAAVVRRLIVSGAHVVNVGGQYAMDTSWIESG